MSTASIFDLIFAPKHPPLHRSEFKELRKQWRKAKKEGSPTPPQMSAPGQPSSNSAGYPSQSMNPYYQAMSDRRRRMTDSSLPGIASYRSWNPYLQSGVGSQPWMEHNQDRRYSLSMAYPSESAVVDDVYSQYDNSSLSGANDQMARYTQYTTQDQHATTTHGYTYPPLQSPPADQPNGSPHSPPNRTGQRLSPLPPTSGMMLNPLDYRSNSGGAPGRTGRDNLSMGSEYDELRTPDQFQSASGGFVSYKESAHGHSHGAQNSEYSLGRIRLPRDSTLLTPGNLDGLRYGKDI